MIKRSDGRTPMPRGDKSKYTDQQKRKAEHIEEGYEHRGKSPKEAERIAWATVNKQDHGGKKGGSGHLVFEPRCPGSESSPLVEAEAECAIPRPLGPE